MATTGLILLTSIWEAGGHDLFLHPVSFRTEAESSIKVLVYDGTFDASVYAVEPESVAKVALQGPHQTAEVNTGSWEIVDTKSKAWRASLAKFPKLRAMNLDLTSAFSVKLQAEGTHTVGITLHQFRVALSLKDFEEYLETEVYRELDMAAYGFTEPNAPVRERYTKLAKTIIQVGDTPTPNVTQPMGLLVEIVPLTHPAQARAGETLEFMILEEGKPISNQSVVANRKRGDGKEDRDSRILLHSNDDGIVALPVTEAGIWWLKFILLQKAPEDDRMDFFSRWATLTFEVR